MVSIPVLACGQFTAQINLGKLGLTAGLPVALSTRASRAPLRNSAPALLPDWGVPSMSWCRARSSQAGPVPDKIDHGQ
jgi:hypothetical protein